MEPVSVNSIAHGASLAAIAFDVWIIVVLWLEGQSYCELPLRRYLFLSLVLSFPASFCIFRLRNRASFRLAFIADCLLMIISLGLLAHGTFLMTLASMEICPVSAPLTWKTTGISLAFSWSLICGASIAVVISAAVGFLSCKKVD